MNFIRNSLAKIKGYFSDKINSYRDSSMMLRQQHNAKVFRAFLFPFFLIAFFLIILPLIILVIYSLIAQSSSLAYIFSFENWGLLFTNHDYLVVFALTLILAGFTTCFAILIGYPVAYILNFKFGKNRATLLLLFTMPIWLNMLLRTLGLKGLVTWLNPDLLGTPFLMTWGMVLLYLPFMILSIYNAMDRISKSYLEASYDLGANRRQTFTRIILPLSLPGVFSGCILVFLPALTTLIIPQFLGNGANITVSKIIENYFLTGDNFPAAAGISFIICLFSFLLWIISKWAEKRFSYVSSKSRRTAPSIELRKH